MEPGRKRERCIRNDPVDATAILAFIKIGRMMRMRGHPFRVLDRQPVEIEQVDGAVRTDMEVHRAKPGVGGGEKLDAFTRTPAYINGSGRRQHIAMDQALGGLGGKGEQARKDSAEIYGDTA